jgi:hypothetical protein
MQFSFPLIWTAIAFLLGMIVAFAICIWQLMGDTMERMEDDDAE